MFTFAVLTVSDKGSKGERVDESGKTIEEVLASIGARLVKYQIVPDELDVISGTLKEWTDKEGIDLILTTGGTGLSPRDMTPEATEAVVDRVALGFVEAIRGEGLKKTPRAMLSRATAGIRGRSLIINLPGSPAGVRESLEVILPVLPHAVEVLRGEAEDCGQVR